MRVVAETEVEHWNRSYSGAVVTIPDPRVIELGRRLTPGARVLDVGSGVGVNAVPLAELGHVVDALDFSAEGLRICAAEAAVRGVASRVRTIEADMLRYRYPRGHYDLVLAMASLHYVADGHRPDRMAAMIERLKATTRSGGRVLLMTNSDTRSLRFTRDRARGLTAMQRRELWAREGGRARRVGTLTRAECVRVVMGAFADRRWEVERFEVPPAGRATLVPWGPRELRSTYWIEIIARRI